MFGYRSGYYVLAVIFLMLVFWIMPNDVAEERSSRIGESLLVKEVEGRAFEPLVEIIDDPIEENEIKVIYHTSRNNDKDDEPEQIQIQQEVIQETPQEDTPIHEQENDMYLVVDVIDGDTIEIEGGDRIRLVCIDTPERGQEGYNEATDYLEDLVLGEDIELEIDVTDRDRYGRLLRYIYLDGDFINEMIVRNGYAKAYPYGDDIRYCNIIEDAEQEARDEGLGIWAGEGDGEFICSFNFYNCGDFTVQADAQEVYDYCGSDDIHRLDQDDDGEVCESLP